ncbi:MAG: Ig-like domain-containing protein [Candidatus Sericytochromatia bacterium]
MKNKKVIVILCYSLFTILSCTKEITNIKSPSSPSISPKKNDIKNNEDDKYLEDMKELMIDEVDTNIVKKTNVESVEISPSNVNLIIGQEISLSASVNLSNKTKNNLVDWKVDNQDIIKIDKDGKITGLKEGETVIYATSQIDSSKSTRIPVIVNKIPVIVSSIELNPVSLSLKVGDTSYFKPIIKMSDGTLNYNAKAKSLNTDIIDVSSDFKITAKSKGEAKIEVESVSEPKIKSNVTVLVVEKDEVIPPPKIVVSEITISEQNLGLTVGNEKYLIATVTYSNNLKDNLVNWSSSNSRIVSITQDGNLVALSEGQAIITASSKSEVSKTVSIPVIVKKIPVIVSSVIIKPSSISLNVGASQTLSGLVIKSDGTSNENVLWKSLNTSIADINSSGLLTAKNKGVTTIEAISTEDNTKKTSVNIEVKTIVNTVSTPSPTATAIYTSTPISTPTNTPSPTTFSATPTPTSKPIPTSTPTLIPSTIPTSQPKPTNTPSLNPTPTSTVTPMPNPISNPTPTPNSTSSSNLNGKFTLDYMQDIYIINADGTNKKQLTHHEASYSSPEINFDGTKIIFISNRSQEYQYGLHLMSSDGIYIKRLIACNECYSYKFSLDSSKIIYTQAINNINYIKTMNSDGSNEKNLNVIGYNPSWSPDTSKIVYSSNKDGNFEIYIMNSDGTNQKRLTNNNSLDFYPSWSPDGNKILFSSDINNPEVLKLYTMNIDGSNLTRIISENNSISKPAIWSPDGKKIAYIYLHSIKIVDSNGLNKINTNISAGDTNRATISWSNN